ncbi:putative alpha/beta hydrolase family protein [Lyophyllum shimeji]|uniref:Alpha/beta hydrolase family protein n=1 Tax=Lyophyllum shimeji TaxID=47721 RepID=A0A9P3UJR7_LYOSH|nr:putative alpha/beta hydrolase family protein [Lyophyllum shimeji]
MGEEQLLELAGGRKIAYAQSGNASSTTVLIFFHGVFGVGDASNSSPVLAAKNISFLAPTLPGWGNSSPIPASKPYHVALAEDITALLKHLYPDGEDSKLTLYVAGGSFGTVPAQMLYGAPFDIFPLGRRVAGCLLLAPFSPFRHHTEYTKTMTLPNYISVGPPSQWIPFHLTQRLIAKVVRSKVKTQASAETFIREELFDKMAEEEQAAFRRWREGKSRTEDEVVQSMAGNVVKSVAKTWAGFMAVSDILHSDWGFRPDTLDTDHTKRPIFIVTSTADTMAPNAMAKWLATQYENAKLQTLTGGHISSLFYQDKIFDEFLDGVQG